MTAPLQKTSGRMAVVHDDPPSLSAFVNGRLTGRYELDEFGYDPELLGVVAPVAAVRWSIDVDGADLLDPGGALVVFSRRLGISEPWVATAAFRSVGRAFRPIGLPDRQPVSSVLAAAGWVPDTPADVRAVLRSGSLAGVGLTRSQRRIRRGSLDVDVMQTAIDLRVPVLPVAVVGREWGRRWQVVIGAPISTKRRSTITAAELADRSRERVAQLLEASGGPGLLPLW